MLKERGQIGQEFSAKEIEAYLKSMGFKPKINVTHYRNHFAGSITFWYRLRKYYIALIQFDKPGDEDPLSSKNGFTQLGMDSKGQAEKIMIQLVAHFKGWYRTTKKPFADDEEWIKLSVKRKEQE
ncbi:hypothetical protein P4829_10625 [Bacillus atrophaeus]|uniref:hypothetical protein n=1 Tax=Bacillus atrophaeus TaxID=1452 RepID=UPI0007C54F3A|nr:hypothetical protein [Bacillus atrophaeus]MDS9995349.1 hypothetical protein [Bacillus atrophaeus]WFE12435.1 hypothetical protein P4829_10625 [Bacillus atrophaeus]